MSDFTDDYLLNRVTDSKFINIVHGAVQHRNTMHRIIQFHNFTRNVYPICTTDGQLTIELTLTGLLTDIRFIHARCGAVWHRIWCEWTFRVRTDTKTQFFRTFQDL